MNIQTLLNKGFCKRQYIDGMFYIIEEGCTELGNKVARLCNLGYNDGFNGYVDEKIILQSNEAMDDFEVYCDGEVWNLTKEEFKDIVNNL